ncbi:MAG: hypothetical protein IJW40_01400 [Clostridia bacterium]|nr:hypothetical protein [Clostridia bacterium]
MKQRKANLPEMIPSARLLRARSISSYALLAITLVVSAFILIRDPLFIRLFLIVPAVILSYFIHSLVFYLICHRTIKAAGGGQRPPMEVSTALLVWSILLALLTLVMLAMILLFTLALSHM